MILTTHRRRPAAVLNHICGIFVLPRSSEESRLGAKVCASPARIPKLDTPRGVHGLIVPRTGCRLLPWPKRMPSGRWMEIGDSSCNPKDRHHMVGGCNTHFASQPSSPLRASAPADHVSAKASTRVSHGTTLEPARHLTQLVGLSTFMYLTLPQPYCRVKRDCTTANFRPQPKVEGRLGMLST
jgi:hypothetical protein